MKNKVIDYEITENISQLVDSKIILYGTSARAENLYPILNMAHLNIVACCDGAAHKIGKYFHEYQIEALADVSKRIDMENTIIIICSTFVEEIMEDCSKICSQQLRFVTSFGLKMAFLYNRNSKQLDSSFRSSYNKQYNTWLLLKKKSVIGAQQWQYNEKLLRFANSDDILVYQMAKVGSTTICNSLSAVGIGNIHIHYFQPWNNSDVPWNDNVSDNFNTLQQIIKQKEKIKIITLVRDPIIREVSQYFQVIPWPDIFYNSSNKITDEIIHTLRKEPVFSWFDKELKDTFGIDVYSVPFDKEKGYKIIKQDNIDCLVLKLEKLNSLVDIIREFVGNKEFSIQVNNSGNDKEYKYLYKAVKETITIPQDVLDSYYNSNAVRHFYTEKEINSLKGKWNKE